MGSRYRKSKIIIEFEITLLAKENGYLSEQLELNHTSFKNEAYTTDLGFLDMDLSYKSPLTENKKFVVSLQPNLLNNTETQLIIEGLPATTLFTRIFNEQGQLVEEYQNQTSPEYYRQTLHLPNAPGIYWIQVKMAGRAFQLLKIVKLGSN